jgi:NAD(P)-dependent dehydrogenase (short-subunit alcohol dehydrogenase family)
MDDKLVVVTGPTSGIGKEIATQMARMGARVVLACRDPRKGEAALVEIAQRTRSKRLSVLELDTSSQSSVRDFTQRFERLYTRLDVLVNNAGVNLRTRRTSVDGIELVFATNVLGYYLVTLELLGLLKAGAPARIVNVASTFAGDLDLEDLEFERRPYDSIKAYRQSKACDRLLTWALARRLGDSGVTVNAMAPGLVQTGLYRETALPLRLMLAVIGLFRGRSVTEGADTAVWLASSPEVSGVSGRLFEQRREIACEFRNEQNEERLFAICEQRIAGAS